MLEITAILTFFLGKYPDTIVIVALLFFNAALSLFQERRARSATTALKQRLRIQSRAKSFTANLLMFIGVVLYIQRKESKELGLNEERGGGYYGDTATIMLTTLVTIGLCTGSETAHATMIVIKKSKMIVAYAILAPLLTEI